jgi:hypothetical protein
MKKYTVYSYVFWTLLNSYLCLFEGCEQEALREEGGYLVSGHYGYRNEGKLSGSSLKRQSRESGNY